jgi:transposase
MIEMGVPAPPLVGVEPNPGPRRKSSTARPIRRWRGQNLSEKDRWRVVILHEEENLSNSEIAKRMNITKSTVQQILKKEQETGTVHDKPGRGRKRKCLPTEEKMIVNLANTKAAPEIARKVSKRAKKKREHCPKNSQEA